MKVMSDNPQSRKLNFGIDKFAGKVCTDFSFEDL
jgi:hypothetical protein